MGQVLDFLLGDVVVFLNDAQDQPALTIGTRPAIDVYRLLDTVVTIGTDLVAAAVLRGLWWVVGLGNEARVLNFLVHGVLQEFVKPLQFSLDLGDVREFDFHGGAEAVAAVLGQTELFAVIGAEFDSHGVDVVAVDGHKKARP